MRPVKNRDSTDAFLPHTGCWGARPGWAAGEFAMKYRRAGGFTGEKQPGAGAEAAVPERQPAAGHRCVRRFTGGKQVAAADERAAAGQEQEVVRAVVSEPGTRSMRRPGHRAS